MLKTSKQIQDEMSELRIKAQAIVDVAKAENRDLSDDEQKSFDSFADSADKMESEELPRAVKRENLEAKARQERKLQSMVDSGQIQFGEGLPKVSVPARAKAHRALKAYENEQEAYVSGHVLLAGLFGNQRSAEFCRNHGLAIQNTMTEHANTAGGFLVPDEMQRSLVRLREERGVAFRFARQYPMAYDTATVPRLLSDVTAYWPGEADEITASDAGLGAAELVARKLACLTKVSTELDEDSVIDVAEMITTSMAYAMADKVDEALFNGDGTSTYGHVLGLKNALHSNAIAVAASGNDSALTQDLDDFEEAVGMYPQYPGASPRWFMHSAVYWASCARLMAAAGGNTIADLGSGPVMQFLGYPVTFTQVMVSTTGTAASTIIAYFGDLSLGCTIGNRRGVRTQVSTDRYFENDLIGIKCTERLAISVHERGDTITNRPIIALKTSS